MTMAVQFGPVQVPRGFGALGFRMILQDELDLELSRIGEEVIEDLKRETIPFIGITRAAWRVVGPIPMQNGNVMHMEFVNDSAPFDISGGITASNQEFGARQHFPPINSRGDGRDLTDWVRRVLPTSLENSASLGAQERSVARTAFVIARKISQRGFPSPSNAGRLGSFNKAVGRNVAAMEARLTRAVTVAIARFAEEDV
jgi:hypothetical protein